MCKVIEVGWKFFGRVKEVCFKRRFLKVCRFV